MKKEQSNSNTQDTKNADIKAEFKEIITKLDNKYGVGTLQFFSEENFQANKDNIIESGSYYLDKALGIGGYPKGRIIEIFGIESSGKTTIALKAVAQCQKKGGKVVYIDAEHALDSLYCEKLGVNLEQMVLCQPNSGEQCFSIIEALIKTKMVDLIIVDSVAALVPKAELDGEFSDQTIGLQARMMSKGLRIIQSLLIDYPVTLIFINQVREKIGAGYGNNTTTSGGRALKFFSSLRMEIKKSELIKTGEEINGIKIKVTTIKNKLAKPLQTAFLSLYFDSGFDYKNEIIDIAIEEGIIKKSGSWFSFEQTNIAQGKEPMRTKLLNNSELFEQIKQEVFKLHKEFDY